MKTKLFANGRTLPLAGLLPFLFITCFANAQSYGVYTFGGTASEEGNSIIQSKDGGYVIAGYTDSYGKGAKDVYVVKLDSSFNLQWERTFGNTNDEIATSLIEADDGGYAISGYSNAFTVSTIPQFILKINSDGNNQWMNAFTVNNCLNPYDTPRKIQKMKDGGYIVAGTSRYDCPPNTNLHNGYVCKFNSSGSYQWGGVIDYFIYNWNTSVAPTFDGGFAMLGYTSGMYIAKIDSANNIQFEKTFNFGIKGNEIIQTSDSGFAIAGNGDTMVNAQNYSRLALARLTKNGVLQWVKMHPVVFGSDTLVYSNLNSIVQTSDDGFAMVGDFRLQNETTTDLFLMRIDSTGNLLWSKRIGDATAWEFGNSIIQTKDGGFAMAGTKTNSSGNNWDIYFVKTDSAGNVCVNSFPFGTLISRNLSSSSATEYFPSTVSSATVSLSVDSGIAVTKICGSGTPLNVAINSTGQSCLYSCDGIATAIPAGGISPFTYLWNTVPPQTTQHISGLCPGNYSVTVINALGDTSIAAVPLAPVDSLVLSISQVNATCNAINDGSATANVTGGIPAIHYYWSNGDTLPTVSNLSVGVYYVYVDDDWGCFYNDSVYISQTNPVLIDSVSFTNASCSGNDGSILIYASGGNASYSYFVYNSGWSLIYQDTVPFADSLYPDTYYVQVFDSAGCFMIDSNGTWIYDTVTISAPLQFAFANAYGFAASCATCPDGWAYVDFIGGTPPYTFSWLPNMSCISDSCFNLLPNTYTVCITDSSGCIICDTAMVSFVTSVYYSETNIHLQLFPNPTTGTFTLKGLTLDVRRLEIYNVYGEKVYETPLHLSTKGESVIVTLPSGLGQGIYFYKVESADETIHTGKLIIQK